MESDVREPWVNWNKEIENTSKRNENEEQSFDEERERETAKKEKPKTIPGTLRNEEEQTVLPISVSYSCISNHTDDNSSLYNIVL